MFKLILKYHNLFIYALISFIGVGFVISVISYSLIRKTKEKKAY